MYRQKGDPDAPVNTACRMLRKPSGEMYQTRRRFLNFA